MSLGINGTEQQAGSQSDLLYVPDKKLEPVILDASTQRLMARYIDDVAQLKCKKAFSALFAYYAPKIKHYMLKIGASSSCADELTQDSFLAVWNKAHLYCRHKAAVSTWLFTIARNKYIDEIRRERRSQLNSILYASDQIESLDSGDVFENFQRQTHMGKALGSLPQQQYDVVYKMYMEGQTQDEIANELDVPVGTIKSRARLAYKKLRREIEVDE